jgi:tetratricopeptide (TPR) repeat protein
MKLTFLMKISLLALILSAVFLVGCRQKTEDPQKRYGDAKALFDHCTKEFHLPSGAASGAEQARLQAEAIKEYQQLLRKYPDQGRWCAEALCSLGNVRAAQTNLTAALECWSEVVAKYPSEEWEVLTALKSSADLLWEHNRQAEAKPFYQKIVAQFDQTNAPAVVRVIVRGSKLKLDGRATER